MTFIFFRGVTSLCLILFDGMEIKMVLKEFKESLTSGCCSVIHGMNEC